MSTQDAATERFLAQRVRLALARAERLADEGNNEEVGAWGFVGALPGKHRTEHFPVPCCCSCGIAGTPRALWALLCEEDVLACLLEVHTRKLPCVQFRHTDAARGPCA
jgi:hypothetical protein